MVALPSFGEFNRVDRSGDSMEGDLDHRDKKVQYTDGAGAEKAYQRSNNTIPVGQLIFYDEEVGVEKTLLDLTKAGLAVDLEEEVVATSNGQSVFNLVTGTYAPGTGTVHVFLRIGWVPRSLFSEPSPTQIQLSPSAAATVNIGDILTVIVFKGVGINDLAVVKGDATDTGPNDLNGKLDNGSGLLKSVTGPVTDRKVNLAVDHATAIPPVSAGAGVVGVATKSAREDHQHPVPAQNPPLGAAIPIVEGIGAAGVSTNASREDHVHPAGGGTPPPVSGMKGATVVASGSMVAPGAMATWVETHVVLTTGGQSHKFHFMSLFTDVPNNVYNALCYAFGSLGYKVHNDVTGGPPLVKILNAHYLKVLSYYGNGGGTIYYKVYRIDES